MNNSGVIEIVKDKLPDDFSLDTNKKGAILYDNKIIGIVNQNWHFSRYEAKQIGTNYNSFLFRIFLREDGTLGASRYYSYERSSEVIDFDVFISIVRLSSKKVQVDEDEKKLFIKKFIEIVNSSDLNKYQKSQLRISVGKRTKIFKQWDSYELTEKEEIRIFMTLLHKYRKTPIDTEVCRYCSLESLIKSINHANIAMMSINCMNDTHENCYVDDYIIDHTRMRAFHNEKEYTKDGNRTFILSCSDISMRDKLFMWNMYGDQSRGVCLKYSVRDNNNQDYKIARISYANEDGIHPELNFISRLLEDGFLALNQLSSWKHFFKSYEYKDENEIRILLKLSQTPIESDEKKTIEWILSDKGIVTPILIIKDTDKDNNFPLVLKEITLGPKCKETRINQLQIQQLLEIKGISEDSVIVEPSIIDSFR